MAADNHTTIVGNLVEDPEVRFTQQQHRRHQPAGRRHPARPAGRPVARRRHQLLQGECVARAGRAPGRLPGQGRPGDGHRPPAPAQLGDPEGEKRSVTELEADEVGASLKWVTAKVERTSQRGNGDRSSGRERQAERGGDFNDPPPF
jgi:single-strand DNA-binding protein